MYPMLPVGPFTVPTGPIMAILAAIISLEVAGRYARRVGLSSDDVWNTGLIALAAGLIVARLWNVVQFWHIYQDELMLMLSPRPSGFAFWPGVIAALVSGYAYLLWRALDPVRVGAALAVGLIAGGSVLSISAFLTGTVLGLKSDLPWAIAYFEELRHPAALYRALGLLLVWIILWWRVDATRPWRVMLWALLGYSITRLVTDGFVADVPLVGDYRGSQLVTLVAALVCVMLLAREARREPAEPALVATPPQPAPE